MVPCVSASCCTGHEIFIQENWEDDNHRPEIAEDHVDRKVHEDAMATDLMNNLLDKARIKRVTRFPKQ